jgi:hypothetical protein
MEKCVRHVDVRPVKIVADLSRKKFAPAAASPLMNVPVNRSNSLKV